MLSIPRQFMARTMIQVEPTNLIMSLPNQASNHAAVIKSRDTLLGAVEQKNLTKRWGMGTDNNQAVEKLEGMIEVSRRENTDLLVIDCYSKDAEESAELANAVAHSFADRLLGHEQERSRAGIAVLTQEMNAQQKKVENARERMLKIAKENGIVDFGSSRFGSLAEGKADILERLESQFEQAEVEVENLRAIKAQLDTLEGEAKVEAAINLTGGETASGLKPFYASYKALLMEREKMEKEGLGPEHPKLQAAEAKIKQMKSDLDASVTAILRGYDAKLKIAEESLQNLEKQNERVEQGFVPVRGHNSQYIMAKKDYENQFYLLNLVQEHVLKERVEMSMPSAPVTWHEQPVVPTEMVPRSDGKYFRYGGALAAFLGLGSLFIWWAIRPRRQAAIS
jgi:uncharacterized protein involved in exopolysaccharide biosynthesis